jgi:hypothetical protein
LAIFRLGNSAIFMRRLLFQVRHSRQDPNERREGKGGVMSQSTIENPATLVAILVAARKVGNRELEREMRQRLEDQGLKIIFLRGWAICQADDSETPNTPQ